MKAFMKAILSLSALVLVWQVACLFTTTSRALFPAPADVAAALYALAVNGSLWAGIGASLLRFGAGYLLAAVLGIGLGLIFGWFRSLWEFVNPVVQLTRPVSPLAWMPFIVLWLGIGDIPAVAVIFIAAFFPVLLTTVKAVREVDSLYINVGRNFGFGPLALMRKIVIPAILPRLVTGLHLAMGSAWIFLVVGEMVGAQSGLGFLIIDARNTMRADMLASVILVIGVLGLLFDWMLARAERWVLFAYSTGHERRRGRR